VAVAVAGADLVSHAILNIEVRQLGEVVFYQKGLGDWLGY